MTNTIIPVDRIEVHTLQDNYIDLTSGDSTDMVKRATPVKEMEIKNSILSEHGFSALVSVVGEGSNAGVLFDFGFSEHGAAYNVDALDLDLTDVQCMVLSHGHTDHTGGLEQLSQRIGREGTELIAHPAVFRHPRYIKPNEDLKLAFPAFTMDRLEGAGIRPILSAEPYLFLDGRALFLGEIPRDNDFERGMPNAFFEENGEELKDNIEDDSSIVFHLKDKGLVVISGCAHSGIINTVHYAQTVTGVEKIHAVMGGFHLGGLDADLLIGLTLEALMEIAPDYVIPTHCTGRTAIQRIEEAMPDNFLLNMSGTKIIFA
jgi:7,8-dihydropterin-6-yl-methyl-4-(beta-D-ribofuranosyl)aminobenzene 5'-phosphate synthase